MERFDPGQVLDALDGIAYATDLDGYIIGIGSRSWAESALANNWNIQAPDSIVGLNLFELITEGEVRSAYRRLHDAVATGLRRRVMFTCRCDSSDAVREMRMSIGGLEDESKIFGVVYHSQIVSLRERPPIAFMSPEDVVQTLREDKRTILSVCSFCQEVRIPETNDWVTPEVYYRSGGDGDVRLSHGVCSDCETNLSELQEPNSQEPLQRRQL